MSLSGIPIGTGMQTSGKRLVFDHIPVLRELLGKRLWLGVDYAQVCIHNLKAAADREEFPARLSPIRNTQYFEIQGPKGIAQMALVGTNVPIGGANSDQGEPLFFTDAEVERLTGLQMPTYQVRDRAGKLVAKKYRLEFDPDPHYPAPEPALPGLPDADSEPPRHRKQKRKYVRRKPITQAQLASLAKAREIQRAHKLRNAHGRMTPLERSDGAQELEGSQAAEERWEGGESNGGVQGGDAA